MQREVSVLKRFGSNGSPASSHWICLGFVEIPRLQTGQTPEDFSREFESMAQSTWNRVRQAARDAGARKDGGDQPGA
jgi:hypothetical protein